MPPLILVVDDEPKIARLARDYLEKNGFRVVTAADGQSALTIARREKPDLLILDLMLPQMDGREVCRILRRESDVPIIMLTASPSLETAIQGIEHRAFRYLTKPVDVVALRETVDHATRLSRLARVKREAMAVARSEAIAAEDLELNRRFEAALATLWIAYQPLVDSKTGLARGYEALLRTRDPALPHPGAVLEAAERLGRLDDLGRRVRRLAIEPIAAQDLDALLFVNLHPRDLLDPALYLPNAPLAARSQQIVLEITERAGIDGIPDVRNRIHELRRLGYRIAIDDLGSGHSGLTSFAILEPDFVKIDMSLVRDIDHSPIKHRLVRSMAEVCRDMGISIVAEGIETLGERAVLVDLGCDLLQGFLLARPGPPFPAVRTFP